MVKLLWLKQPKYAQKTADGTAEMHFSVNLYKKKSFEVQELAAPPQAHLIMLFQEVFPKSNTEFCSTINYITESVTE